MASEKKRKAKAKAKSKPKPRRVVFKKADYQKFARKLESFSETLSPEERALLIAVLNKGSRTIRAASDDVVQTAITVGVAARNFDLGQFIVKILLALQGIEAVVEEDGPSWVQEITATTKT